MKNKAGFTLFFVFTRYNFDYFKSALNLINLGSTESIENNYKILRIHRIETEQKRYTYSSPVQTWAWSWDKLSGWGCCKVLFHWLVCNTWGHRSEGSRSQLCCRSQRPQWSAVCTQAASLCLSSAINPRVRPWLLHETTIYPINLSVVIYSVRL